MYCCVCAFVSSLCFMSVYFLFVLFYFIIFCFFLFFFFFFSSRRRHTRCLSDWSSDVCSSDLRMSICPRRFVGGSQKDRHSLSRAFAARLFSAAAKHRHRERPAGQCGRREIGRASCRERV